MTIYPAIDLREGRCVRLRQGDYQQQTTFADDPVAVGQRFAEAGARWLHVVDLDAARAGRPFHLEVVRNLIAATGLAVQVGGGVRTLADARAWLAVGVARVIVGTRAALDWAGFTEMVAAPDLAGRVALGLDARDGTLAVAGWTQATDLTTETLARRANGLPLAAIIATDIGRDGMMAGVNLAATASLAAVTSHRVIHSGGVTTLEDVRALCGLAIEGTIIGRALYEGRINLREAIAIANQAANTAVPPV